MAKKSQTIQTIQAQLRRASEVPTKEFDDS